MFSPSEPQTSYIISPYYRYLFPVYDRWLLLLCLNVTMTETLEILHLALIFSIRGVQECSVIITATLTFFMKR